MSSAFRRICVFCGSRRGANPAYEAGARELGVLLAEQDITLVYGGGSVGLMGVLADACLEAGGRVIGVIPKKLDDLEVGHHHLTRKEVVATMHERKARMAVLSDAFIAMPGGYGTLEELAEVTTWSQLNDHMKPVGVLNIAGYWDHLLAQVHRMVDEGFVHEVHRDLIVTSHQPDILLERLQASRIPELHEWLGQGR